MDLPIASTFKAHTFLHWYGDKKELLILIKQFAHLQKHLHPSYIYIYMHFGCLSGNQQGIHMTRFSWDLGSRKFKMLHKILRDYSQKL